MTTRNVATNLIGRLAVRPPDANDSMWNRDGWAPTTLDGERVGEIVAVWVDKDGELVAMLRNPVDGATRQVYVSHILLQEGRVV